tara:strand:+ start:440 stop:1327 length:888 start_codon:yes stop_codon:yes gene_type:complete
MPSGNQNPFCTQCRAYKGTGKACPVCTQDFNINEYELLLNKRGFQLECPKIINHEIIQHFKTYYHHETFYEGVLSEMMNASLDAGSDSTPFEIDWQQPSSFIKYAYCHKSLDACIRRQRVTPNDFDDFKGMDCLILRCKYTRRILGISFISLKTSITPYKLKHFRGIDNFAYLEYLCTIGGAINSPFMGEFSKIGWGKFSGLILIAASYIHAKKYNRDGVYLQCTQHSRNYYQNIGLRELNNTDYFTITNKNINDILKLVSANSYEGSSFASGENRSATIIQRHWRHKRDIRSKN